MADVAIEELSRLLPLATRPNVKDFLQTAIASARANKRPPPAAEPRAPAGPPPPVRLATEPAASSQAPKFVAFKSYAWDQNAKWVKVYLTVPGSAQLPEQQVSASFNVTAVTIEVRALPLSTASRAALSLSAFRAGARWVGGRRQPAPLGACARREVRQPPRPAICPAAERGPRSSSSAIAAGG